ncbi:transporter associated domain protein [Terribacillus saccharophilus]|uniref:Transporter associated domain protein n=1 Tax=Terribacillus saccharophilus TaxID=361277 RepID=A0A268HDD8_9BACI|nr:MULTISPECIES: hemolysin family protein [Terribacillus]PAD33988.1 transporter associated domain protein [Terribacillus saccharophilus]PAD94767.1 transporter associated domain protein [Terribacillus saccharophilus]PAD98461.1 transporter associated domain protein [Terribacillus saccharophilus]PAE07891.1 transporter associated domain protein [Terribacillus saccharophilus]
MDPSIVINLSLVVLFIIFTAFFVGAEFSVVKVRMSRIDQLVAEGNKRAIIVSKLVNNLDYYLSACQLGITVTALVLGALGEPTVEKILHPLFNDLGLSESVSTLLSYAIAFASVTFLHVVIGELAPKTLAIQYTEQLTLILGPPLYWFGKLMAPFIYLLNGSARVFLKLFGVKPAAHESAHSEEELRIIMTQSYQSGEINKTELSYMENIFTFDERVAKDIMVPRTQVVTLEKSMTAAEVIEIIDEHQFTRYLVTEDGDKDHIIGFVNVKEMLTDFAAGRRQSLPNFIHELPLIHEGTSLQDALLKMQTERVHIALVVDEYGGTAGILTMEDILEEIVGEIHDEFDEDEVPDIQEVSDRTYHINGRVLLDDLEDQFGSVFDNREDVDTIGGWIFVKNDEVDSQTTVVDVAGNEWEVIEMDNHQILMIELRILEQEQLPMLEA